MVEESTAVAALKLAHQTAIDAAILKAKFDMLIWVSGIQTVFLGIIMSTLLAGHGL